ncbi:MAG: 3-phosphoshikimate 1-carboxyvinyltransferase [Chitinophagales bacterium]
MTQGGITIKIEFAPSKPLKGEIEVPPDKSISHRAVILGALAVGKSSIENLLKAADVSSTIKVIRSLGVKIKETDNRITVHGQGLDSLMEPDDVLDCGNSGTTMRLVAGLAASLPFQTIFTGDKSLRRRPMKRIIIPLRQMGAEINGRENGSLAPLVIRGGNLKAIQYQLPVASAQVKSAVLLAGLGAQGRTSVIEDYPSRDHTERMLSSMGARITVAPRKTEIEPSRLAAQEWIIPGDISSAAFWMIAGSLISGSEIQLRNVGINPTRIGILEVLQGMGANIGLENYRQTGGEPVADIIVKSSEIKPCEIRGEMIPRLIDEIPVLTVAMAKATGKSVVRNAQELRSKESDRIAMIVKTLTALGVKVEEFEDGFSVYGEGKIPGGVAVDSGEDHRIAMASAVAGLVAEKPVVVEGFQCVNISYPSFTRDLSFLVR